MIVGFHTHRWKMLAGLHTHRWKMIAGKPRNQTISTVYADKVAKRVLHEKTHDLGLGKLQTLKHK
jgi:predicted Zn-dependent protease